MAKRRRKKSNEDLPGWIWMLFGLAIGLSVALAIYLNDRTPTLDERKSASEPSGKQAAVEAKSPKNSSSPPVPEKEPRFTFYKVLPAFELIIPEQDTEVSADKAPTAVVKPGEYVLQAGSFSRFVDADRRRAQLAMQGIESHIQPVTIDDKSYHRVRIGPIRDLDELNLLRARLRAAKIDVLRIRLGD